MDDNVSGSAVQRPGLDRLKEDILKGSIDVVLVKDLSRLGRNNAGTLSCDFFEEHGVRVLTADDVSTAWWTVIWSASRHG